ncbi:MAG: UDP-N-acetylmuramoyl-L-alanine--D-glutamate ligase [Clostridia bacterium]|nr:UDP-N-acetylmuramoyl-L-alanine--D-glutamate ligase [Clostridia bacterium]
MINNLIDYFKDKKILILGFGREGQSTYNLIRKYLPEQQLYIADQKEDFQNNFDFLKSDNHVTFIGGENYLEGLEDYDVIMKSPGISFAHLDTSKFIHKIKSQLELLLEFFENFTIGITGTKGKSTTSSLIYKVISEQDRKCILLGNIGVPVFDYVDSIDQDVIMVLEMSSHQLEFMELSPNIAILLNVWEEHLDHYESFIKYAEAKCNIYKYQKENDYFLFNEDNETLSSLVKNPNGITYKVSMSGKSDSDIFFKDDKVFMHDKQIYDKNEQRNLVGDYNLNNIMFVLGVSEILHLDLNKTIKSISEFKTLNHRLEFVGEFDGVKYYDNSIGTIPVATIEAVKALKEVDSLIIGGMDRGVDYKELIEFLNNSEIGNIICMPKTGHDIAKELKQEKCHIVDTMEEAVAVAKKYTKKGKICLLSPAAASYGFFKNFEEKGDIFKQLVQST